MSAIPPFPSGRPDEGRWPYDHASLYGAGDAHAYPSALLDRCFDGRDARWSDALVARMRRHIGGCFTAIEYALRRELQSMGEEGARLIASVPQPLTWAALQRQPILAGAELLLHFRDRAAISLIAQDDQNIGLDGVEDQADLFSPETMADLLRLYRAQGAWADAGPDEQAMEPDLPAEIMAHLVWAALALISDTLIRSGVAPSAAILLLADKAGRSVLARHDEQAAPFGVALLLAHRLHRTKEMSEAHLLWLARNRQVLALFAIMADRNGLDLLHLVRHLIDGPEYLLFQLCRSADFPREVAVRLMLGRRSVARGVEDSVLVEYAEEYERMSRESALLAVEPLGLAPGFQAKLAALNNGVAGHGR